MQRKNNLLGLSKLRKRASESTTKTTLGSILSSREHFSLKNIPYAQTKCKRSGFAMISAVLIMIVVATIMMFTINQTTQTVKRTADLYLYEQVELHIKSATEYALFRIAGNNTAAGCINALNFTIDTIYDVNITMQYVFNPIIIAGAGCTNYIGTLVAPEQDGSVLMDVTISVDADDTGSEPIRYFRRTIQKL